MSTETMTPIATICHNDHRPEDGVRVTLYRVEGDTNVWAAAADEQPYRTDVPLSQAHAAWSGREWDLQTLPAWED